MSVERSDLGVLLHRVLSVVLDREGPLLAAHGLQMWEYVVLGGLEHGPAPTQNQLAAAVRRDKTRLIPLLDRLQARGLVDRRPDPADRRNRVVALTEQGRDLLAACRRDIRGMEEDLLSALDPPDAAAFVRALARLATTTDGAPPSPAPGG